MRPDDTSAPADPGTAPLDASRGQETPPAGTEATIRPYSSEKQILQAAKQIGQKTTRLSQRQKIMSSLRQSGIMAGASVPTLLDTYRAQEVSGRHEILDFLGHLMEQGASLSEHTTQIAAYLNDTNTALREKDAGLLIRMGSAASGAETAALGCMRNSVREIRLTGLRVLAAIGTAGAPLLLSRLRSMMETVPATDAEMRGAIDAVIEAISPRTAPEGPSAAPPVEAGIRDPMEDAKVKARLLRLIGEIARFGTAPEVLEHVFRRLEDVPMRTRLHALLGCFSSPEAGVRTVATAILRRYRADLAPFVKIIASAFRIETDYRSREQLGALLSDVLQDIQKRQPQKGTEGVPPGPATAGPGPAGDRGSRGPGDG